MLTRIPVQPEAQPAVCSCPCNRRNRWPALPKRRAGEKDKNKVGILFNLLMKTDDNSGITLSTATNFRGDDKCIIQSSHLGKFKRFRLPFNIHFMSLEIG